MTKSIILNPTAIAAFLVAVAISSSSSSFAAKRFSPGTASTNTQTQKPADGFIVKKARISKGKLRRVCKKNGGTFTSYSNGVYSCMSKVREGPSSYIVECTSPRSCELYRG